MGPVLVGGVGPARVVATVGAELGRLRLGSSWVKGRDADWLKWLALKTSFKLVEDVVT